MSTRIEHDLLGQREVSNDCYYGVQTLRAVENFNISRSKLRDFPFLIYALADVKEAAAMANRDLGILDPKTADAIIAACQKIRTGQYNEQFPVDMMQGGAGTSTNMNANEVIANLALEILGHKKGEYVHCHANNHVNLSQSTNDAYPTALKLALHRNLDPLKGSLLRLVDSLNLKSKEFSSVIKMGRTQLQDAVPMTLGQEFQAFAANLLAETRPLKQ